MADEVLKIDANNKNVAGAVTDDSNQFIKMLRIDDTTKGLKVNVVGGIPIVAGSDQEVQYNQNGALGASSHFKFDYTNQQLKIGGVATILDGSAINPITTGGLTNTYFATYIQNTSNGISASSDVTAGNNIDDGTLTGHYVDMGINSSLYNDPTITVTTANDTYLYGAGGNLVIGASTTGKVINFFTGGLTANKVGASLSGGTFSLGLVNTTLGALKLFGSTSGNVTIQPNAVAGSNIVLTAPATTGTIALTSQITSGTVTTVSVATANGFSGTVTNPTTTPAITIVAGAITPTSVNGLTITANGTNTLNIATGKTLTVSNTVTLAGTDGQTYTFPSTSATIARTDAANTFTGVQTITNMTVPAGGQILLAVPSAAGASGFTTSAFNSGYSSTAIGDLMYLDSSTTWQKADATTSTATKAGLLGIALSVAASGAAPLVALPGSFVFATAWNLATVGAPVYMSTAGGITLTQPSSTDNAIRVIGWVTASGNGTTKIFFQPSPDYITHT